MRFKRWNLEPNTSLTGIDPHKRSDFTRSTAHFDLLVIPLMTKRRGSWAFWCEVLKQHFCFHSREGALYHARVDRLYLSFFGTRAGFVKVSLKANG